MIRPVSLGPESHVWKFAWIASGVVPPGEPRLQSLVLERIRDTNDAIKCEERILVIPKDGRQTKYLLGDGIYTHVCVAIRGAPETAKLTPGGVVNQLKRPTKLGNNVCIGQCCHIRMGPSMHGEIILVCLEGHEELVRIRDDIHSDVKMSCPDAILVKKFVQVIGWLYKHMRMGIKTPSKAQRNGNDSLEEDRHRTQCPRHPQARHTYYRRCDSRMCQSKLED